MKEKEQVSSRSEKIMCMIGAIVYDRCDMSIRTLVCFPVSWHKTILLSVLFYAKWTTLSHRYVLCSRHNTIKKSVELSINHSHSFTNYICLQ